MKKKILSRYDSEGNEYFNDYHEFTKSIQEKLIPEKKQIRQSRETVPLTLLLQYGTSFPYLYSMEVTDFLRRQ